MAERSTASIIFKAMTLQWQRAMLRVQATMVKVRARMAAVSTAAKRVLLVGAGAFALVTRAALKQEKAEVLLDAALKTTGHSVDLYGQKLRDAASAMQEVTIHGDEFILELMSMGLNLGLTADGLEESTKQALGLAKALGQDARAGMRNYALAVQGNFLMLARYIPAIRAVETAQEKLIEVNKLATQGYLQLQAEAATTLGRLIQLLNTIGDLAEKIGDVFLPKTKEMAETMKPIVETIQKWVIENKVLILETTKLILKFSALVIGVFALTKAFDLLVAHPVGAFIIVLGAAYAALAQEITKATIAAYKMPGITDSTRRAVEELEAAELSAAEGLKFMTEMQGAITDKEKKRSKSVKEYTDALHLQADTFGMSARELAFYKLSLDGLTDTERTSLAQAEQSILVKERSADATKKLESAEKDRTAALRQQLEDQGDFRDTTNALIRSLAVAEGWLAEHAADVERIAEQYGVTVEQAKRFVEIQNRITDLTTKEKEERQAMARIEGPLAAFRRMRAAAATPRRVTTQPSGTSTPNSAQKKAADAAKDSRDSLKQILDIIRGVERKLPFAARAG